MTVALPDEAKPDSIQAFADDLRELRRRSGLDSAALSARTGLLEETIENLLRGDELYSWEATCVYVNACADDTAGWWARWKSLTLQLNRRVWWKAEVVGPLPDPAAAVTRERFAELLAELKGKFREASYEKLEKRAEAGGNSLPHATLNAAIKDRRLLSVERVQAFVAACGLPDSEVRRWRTARIQVDVSAPHSPNANGEPPARRGGKPPRHTRSFGVRRRVVGAACAALALVALLLVAHVVKLELASPVYLSLVPNGTTPSAEVAYSVRLPVAGDWDVEIDLRPRNNDPYSDCLSRSMVTVTVNGQTVGPANAMSLPRPIRLRFTQVDAVSLHAVVTVPAAGGHCSMMVLDLDRVAASPVVPGWLAWLP